MRCSMAVTPHGEQAKQFPYYCPLCMEHYADVLVTQCCSNYTCVQCVLDYLQSRPWASPATAAAASQDINVALALLKRWEGSPGATEAGQPAQPQIECPQCTQAGYCPCKVVLGSHVRSYSCSPKGPGDARAALFLADGENRVHDHVHLPQHAGPGTPPRLGTSTSASQGAACHSPLRAGASFSELKRKMRLFQEPRREGEGVERGAHASAGKPRGGVAETEGVASPGLRAASPVPGHAGVLAQERRPVAAVPMASLAGGGAELVVRGWLRSAMQGCVEQRQERRREPPGPEVPCAEAAQLQLQLAAQGVVSHCVSAVAQRLLAAAE